MCSRQLLKSSLHWLPVQQRQRIQYKIAVITHKARSTSVPPYIDELLQRQVTTRSLRSTDAPHLSVPWTRTEKGQASVLCGGSERLDRTRNASPNRAPLSLTVSDIFNGECEAIVDMTLNDL